MYKTAARTNPRSAPAPTAPLSVAVVGQDWNVLERLDQVAEVRFSGPAHRKRVDLAPGKDLAVLGLALPLVDAKRVVFVVIAESDEVVRLARHQHRLGA